MAGLFATAVVAAAVPAPASAQPRPGPPEDLEAKAVSQTSIELEWEEDDNERSVTYNVYRDGAFIANTSREDYTDTGLRADTRYTYRVRGVDYRGRQGSQSNEASATTFPDNTKPSKVTGVTATAVSKDRIDVAWSAASDPESGVPEYRVHRNGTVITTVSGTSYQDTGLQPFTEYTYRISAINGEGLIGQQSSPVATRTLDGSAPTKPQNLVATANSSTEVGLSWSAATDPQTGVDEYRVFRDDTHIASVNGTSYTDQGLEPETEYEYKVSAVNGDGLVGPKSDPAVVTTPRAIDETPPTVPEGLQAVASSPLQVDLSWSASTDPESGVAEYRVYRDDALIASATDVVFEDTGVESDTEYRYRVSAVNVDDFESEPSSEVVVRTPPLTDDTPPSAPESLAASAASPTRVDLQWSAAADPESGVAQYRVYRGDVLIASTIDLSYADLGLTAETEYSYEVSAVNGDGLEGPRAGPEVVTTPPVMPPSDSDTMAPAPPTGLRVVSP